MSLVEKRWQQIKSTDCSSVTGFQQSRTEGVFMLSKGEWTSFLSVGREGECFGKTFTGWDRNGRVWE